MLLNIFMIQIYFENRISFKHLILSLSPKPDGLFGQSYRAIVWELSICRLLKCENTFFKAGCSCSEKLQNFMPVVMECWWEIEFLQLPSSYSEQYWIFPYLSLTALPLPHGLFLVKKWRSDLGPTATGVGGFHYLGVVSLSSCHWEAL